MTRAPSVAQPFRVADRRPAPWKNGQGVTRELALEPPDSDLDRFDWRVTVAEIASGPFGFSLFPGIDRRTVVTGFGMRLGPAGTDAASMRDVPPWTVLELAGEQPLDAILDGVSIRAFNLMVRREALSGTVTVHTASARLGPADAFVLWCVRGAASLDTGFAPPCHLDAGQAVSATVDASPGTVDLTLAAEGTLVLAALLHDHRRHA